MLSVDLSCAFDCVDQNILPKRLFKSNGLRGSVPIWFDSFLANHTMSVSHMRQTKFVPVMSGVPQGSVLGPVFFSLYIADIVPLVHRHGLNIHLLADDIVIYGSSTTNDIPSFSARIYICFGNIKRWLASNSLRLNSEKTKFMWYHAGGTKSHVQSALTTRVWILTLKLNILE